MNLLTKRYPTEIDVLLRLRFLIEADFNEEILNFYTTETIDARENQHEPDICSAIGMYDDLKEGTCYASQSHIVKVAPTLHKDIYKKLEEIHRAVMLRLPSEYSEFEIFYLNTNDSSNKLQQVPDGCPCKNAYLAWLTQFVEQRPRTTVSQVWKQLVNANSVSFAELTSRSNLHQDKGKRQWARAQLFYPGLEVNNIDKGDLPKKHKVYFTYYDEAGNEDSHFACQKGTISSHISELKKQLDVKRSLSAK